MVSVTRGVKFRAGYPSGASPHVRSTGSPSNGRVKTAKTSILKFILSIFTLGTSTIIGLINLVTKYLARTVIK